MSKTKQISRRKFIGAASGISFLVVGYPLVGSFRDGKNESGKSSDGIVGARDITAWVHLGTNGKVLIYNPAAEMGQGSMTALPAIIAEEMDADWSNVIIEHSPIEPSIYGRSWGRGRGGGGSMLTVGSRAVTGYFDNLRHAGAQARYVILSNVAEKWGVPISELSTEPGLVIHKKSDKKITYGEVAQFAVMPAKVPEIPESELKKPEDFRLIGKIIPRFDIPSKVNGSAKYAIDIQLPNMAYAVISRSPVHRSIPTLENESDIKSESGVTDVLTLNHGVAIVANTVWQALEAKSKLKINWSTGAKAESHNSAEAFEHYEKALGDLNNARSIEDKGNVESALKSAAHSFSYTYKNDYIYHAQMEPLNAVVSIAEDGKTAEAWVGTQGTDGARSAVAKELGLDFKDVTLHPQYLGGGFGRRSLTDYVVEATQIAKNVKKPIKLIWTREDDIKYGAFRPMSLQRMQAGLDESGNIIAWDHTIVGTGGGLSTSGAATNHYSIPNQRIVFKNIDHGVRTKHWRAVGHGANKLAIEAFISEIALDQNLDPVELRKNLMANDSKAIKVLETVVDMANWDPSVKNGRAQGIAFAERSGSLAAGVCEISVDESTGQIQVHKVWSALDAGIVVQPDNAIAQMEGAICMGISSVLHESIEFKNGEVQQSNFHDYEILRMSGAPEVIEVKLIKSDSPPNGLGETGLPWVGGAIADAFARLTGKRIRHMPFSKERVLKVLGS